VKEPLEVADPPGAVTLIAPVVAPLGTFTTSCVALAELTEAVACSAVSRFGGKATRTPGAVPALSDGGLAALSLAPVLMTKLTEHGKKPPFLTLPDLATHVSY
jgi:hypothetical protein